jgi:hypothetical protein
MHDDEASSSTDTSAVMLPHGKLTRAEVARRLGVSVTTLRRMEGTKLHPTRRSDGVHLFDATEVEAVLVTYRQVRSRTTRASAEADGALAAQAFECFDQRVPVSEVVKRLQIAPERAAAFQIAWSRLKRVDPASGVGPDITPDGELAARAFELFATGNTPREVVVELRQSPEIVRKLYDDFVAFCAAEGAVLLPWHMVRELLDLGGLPTDRASNPQTLLVVIRAMRDRIHELTAASKDASEELANLKRAGGARSPT